MKSPRTAPFGATIAPSEGTSTPLVLQRVDMVMLIRVDDVLPLPRQPRIPYSGIEAGYNNGFTDSEIRRTLDLP